MTKVKIPDGAEIFENDLAEYWFEDRLLVSRSKSTLRTVANIRANADFIRKICNGARYPLLIYLSRSPMPDKETRRVSAEILPQNYSAMAMVAESTLATLIMRAVFAFSKPAIPIRAFRDAAAAKTWLNKFAR